MKRRRSGRSKQVDVLVIGGGVVGSAILRSLARYDVSLALLERNADICDATSKANSGIVHTGFDAPPATLEARLLREARDLWPEVIADLRIPYLQTGAVMIVLNEDERAVIDKVVLPTAERNGVLLVPLTRDEILDAVPAISSAVHSGVLVEGEGVIDPFWTTRAFCESAIRNGAEVFLGRTVTAIMVGPRSLEVRTSQGEIFQTQMVVNAAGLWADEIARQVGDNWFRITPRKGEFIITEEDHGIGVILLPVPSRISKGILAAPIVFGGTLMGPTADDIDDKSDVRTTQDGLARVREEVGKLAPGLAAASSIRQFAGLRAVCSTGGYLIGPSRVTNRLLHVAGIRSTGLSASPAIGRYVADLVRDTLQVPGRTRYYNTLPERNSGSDESREGDGDVICLCRSITRGEILDSLRGPLPPVTLDALKRRTGVMLGECQGNLCVPHLLAFIEHQLGRDPLRIEKNIAGSYLIAGRHPQGGH